MINTEVLKEIEKSEDVIFELQSLLCSIPALAPESGGDGELKKAEALEKWLITKGFKQFERFDSKDSRVSSGIRPNLLTTIQGEDDESKLWVISHLDVVPAGEIKLWDTEPFKAVKKGNKIYGRGVEDNQQAVVSSIIFALAYISAGIKPKHTIKLLFVADEEVGSIYGIQHILNNHKIFNKTDLIVVPDGGCEDGSEVEIAEKHVTWIKITTSGKQCHGSRPDDGANAFLAASDFAVRVHELENTVFNKIDNLFVPNRTTINPTKKEANIPNVNTIPGEDVFYFDIRILPFYKVSEVMSKIDELAREIEKKYSVQIKRSTENSSESKPTPADANIVLKISEAINRVYGVKARTVGVGGGTVAAHFRSHGYDAVVWTRIDETAHMPNENCKIENVIGDAKVFAYLAAN